MTYYFVCFLLSSLVLIFYSIKQNSRYNVHLSTLFIFVLLANFGYWQMSLATTLPHAILANKIIYIGGCLIPLTLLLTIFSFCKIRLHKGVKLFLYLFTFFVLLCVFSIGHYDWYYKDVSLGFENGVYFLVKEYGPMHALYYPMIICYALFGVIAMVYTIVKRKSISLNSVLLLLLADMITLAAFFFGRLISNIELMPACYVLAQGLLLLFANRLVLYDVDEIFVASLLKRSGMGVASFDKANRFLGCDEVACECYPALKSLCVDWAIPQNVPELQQLRKWLSAPRGIGDTEFDYSRDGRFYRVSVQPMETKWGKGSCHLLFSDCTEDKQREQHLQQIAVTDQLTGLSNRRAYLDDITALYAERLSEDLYVVAADLNGLKRVNDSKGHAAGDRLILAAADCMRASLCRYGKVYRTGGDEFAAILHCDETQLRQALEVLQRSTEQWQEKTGEVLTISVGAAASAEFPELDFHSLQKEADKRMYADKTAYYKRTGQDRRKG